MRQLAILLAVLLVGTVGLAQSPGGNIVDVFVPLSLSTTGVGALTARATTTAYADTTKSIDVQDYEHVYLLIQETVSDTINLHVYYRGSVDGITYATGTTDDAWMYVDSINWKPSTNNALFQRSFELPTKALGFKSVQFKIHCPGTVPLGGTTTGTTYPKLSYQVVRKFRK